MGFASHQKPPGTVGFFATGGVTEVEKESFARCDGVEGIALPCNVKAHIAGAGGVIDITEHGEDGDGFAGLICHKVGLDAVGWVVVEPNPSGKGCAHCAVAVAQANPDAVSTWDDKEAEVAIGDDVRFVFAVAVALQGATARAGVAVNGDRFAGSKFDAHVVVFVTDEHT